MLNVIESHVVPDSIKEIHIEKYVLNEFMLLHTRKGVKKAIKRRCIIVDGKRCETGFKLRPGQKIDLIEAETGKPGSLQV